MLAVLILSQPPVTGTLAALVWEGKWSREDQVVEHWNLHL